jgi:hypothetical protein
VDLSSKNYEKSPKQDNFPSGFIWVKKGGKSRIQKPGK